MHLLRPPSALSAGGPAPSPRFRRRAAAASAPRPYYKVAAPRASGGDADAPDEGTPESSIDELAAMLSKRAAEMRASIDEGDEQLPAAFADEDDVIVDDAAGATDAALPLAELEQADSPGSYAPPIVMPPHDNGFVTTDFQVGQDCG